MPATAGRALVVKVDTTTGGTFTNNCQGLRSATMNRSGNTIDVSEIGTTFMQRIMGIKDGTYSLQGFWIPTDTTGQAVIQTAWTNDSPLFIRFLPNGTAGFQQEVKVTSINISGSYDGANEATFELEGTGAITSV